MKTPASFSAPASATLLCVGPMSDNCIAATVDVADTLRVPICFIASRRQVEARELGGGYVSSTEEFARSVLRRKSPYIFIGRDHGGPCQGVDEAHFSGNVRSSLEAAKRSFETDIDAGFQFIHIDPSIPVGDERLTTDTILDRLFELYAHCYAYARKKNKRISFEVGTEEQSGLAENIPRFSRVLAGITAFCRIERLPKPAFVVAQTGTKVIRTENIGLFNSIDPDTLANCVRSVRTIVDVCNREGVRLKEHNADYLFDEALALRPVLGIHASNVAPEFGVAETRSLLYLMRLHRLSSERRAFIELAVASHKWDKWSGDKARVLSDEQKAVLCGHYVFTHPECVRIKKHMTRALARSGVPLDRFLQVAITARIVRYLTLFNLTGR